MNAKEIKDNYLAVCNWVTRQQLKKALETLLKMAQATELGDTIRSVESLSSTYESMLRYTLEGVEDPERMKVYNRLRTSILELNDEIRSLLNARWVNNHITYLQMNLRTFTHLPPKQAVSSVRDLSFYHQIEEAIEGQFGLTRPPAGDEQAESLMHQIFRYLWLTDKYGDTELTLTELVLDHKGFSWYQRSLFVSAITLSLFRFFDLRKFKMLHRFFLDNEEEVRPRALVGLLLAFYLYDQRLFLYPELKEILNSLKEESNFQEELESVTLQIIRTRETENISRKLRDDIIPEIQRMGPDLQEKLNLDKLLPEDFDEDRNPDWKKVFKGSEKFYEKMEEYSRMQMEGSDVFMSAFAHLKNFPFFEEIENWFVPFVPENNAIREVLQLENLEIDREMFLEGLSRTPFLCNSDKYSFCLNLRIIPDEQRQMILKLFSSELEGMNELSADEEMTNPLGKRRRIYAQYLQDMYRFFKLYRHRDSFEDIFSMPLDIFNAGFFRELGDNQSILENIGNYFFEHDYFEDSLDIFLVLENMVSEPSFELLEKIGFAYQKLKQYDEALKYYQKAELLEDKQKWLTRKIAFCYRKINKPEQAIEYYRRASQDDPDNTVIQAALGHCYLDMEDFETALQHFFRVEYRNPDDIRILRPIAWCYLALGQLEKSWTYYLKILDAAPTGHDYLNAGHVAWGKGDRKEAIRLYRLAIKSGFEDFPHFLRSFRADKAYLLAAGIDPADIPLMLDYLEYALESSSNGDH